MTAATDAGQLTDVPSEPEPQKWERLLWKKQPFPDNYVPPTFLDKLETNSTVVLPSYPTLIIWSLPITQQVASILIFVSAFAHLLRGQVSALELALGSSASMLSGWLLFEVLIPEHHHPHRVFGPTSKTTTARERIRRAANTIVSLLLLSLALLALSPVLRTLTDATTSDSIWALSAFLFALNAALADYSSGGRSRWVSEVSSFSHPAGRKRSTSVSAPSREDHGLTGGVQSGGLASALSLNAAICAAVVLASRLPSDLDVFALMLCAVHLFAILPLASVRLRACELEIVPVRRPGSIPSSPESGGPRTARLQERMLAQDGGRPISRASIPVLRARHIYLAAQFSLTMLMVLVSAGTFWFLSPSAAVLSVILYVFISVGSPAWMRWAQRWKRELKGPWDPAVPRVNRPE
ncbi:glycosylphosphatidylinositol anchor biosynthesis [Tilletia horrida]|uniref:Glycosylphosphatidylinositol anchor biosynthesis n=1 Tax=Tilletia horrida TaxID=155126 RepID=A0AAN6K191_9BASI|nr:glycosylphosphatidylinositol anchor biosynthesis [Tilletia horrida]